MKAVIDRFEEDYAIVFFDDFPLSHNNAANITGNYLQITILPLFLQLRRQKK